MIDENFKLKKITKEKQITVKKKKIKFDIINK
jgi:hypothetical protein